MDDAHHLLRLLQGPAEEPEPQALQQHLRGHLEVQTAPVLVEGG